MLDEYGCPEQKKQNDMDRLISRSFETADQIITFYASRFNLSKREAREQLQTNLRIEEKKGVFTLVIQTPMPTHEIRISFVDRIFT